MTKEKELLHMMRIDGIDSCSIHEGLGKLTDEARKNLDDECEDVDFYQRLAYIYLLPCCQDGILADEEVDNIRTSIKYIFNRAGISENADSIINQALDLVDSRTPHLMDDTVRLFKKYLSKETLKGIISDCYYMCDADGMAEEESALLIELYNSFMGK